MSTPTPTPPAIQTIDGHTARIVKSSSTGERFAILDGLTCAPVPLAILPLGAGRSAWTRRIVCKCEYCRTPHESGTMEQSTNGLQCAKCFEKAGEELAAQDA